MKKLTIFFLLLSFSAYSQPTIIIAVQQQGGGNPEPPASGDWFVDGSVVSSGNGMSHGQDFKTIGEAASVADDGDLVLIYDGVYRETIVPANSGSLGDSIYFHAAPGENNVDVSGLNLAGTSGWSLFSTSVYAKTLTPPLSTQWATSTASNTALMNNQVYRGGAPMIQAMYPNMPNNLLDDLIERGNWRQAGSATSISGTAINDSGIPLTDYTGTYVVAHYWFAGRAMPVNSRSGSTLNLGSGWWAGGDAPKRWYVTGAVGLLDAVNEFHWSTNTLYVYATSPPNDVEYKSRNYGFDLTLKSYISIKGINFIGCVAAVNGDHWKVDGRKYNGSNTSSSTSKYASHGTFIGDQNSGIDVYSGIKTGAYCEVRNMDFTVNSGTSVWMEDYANIHHNKFRVINYAGNYGAPGRPLVGADNWKFNDNTVNGVGRSAIDLGYLELDHHYNAEIKRNDFGHCMKFSYDGASLYGGLQLKIDGTVIAYNYMHHQHAKREGQGGDKGAMASGPYFDQYVGYATIHHNVFEGIDDTYDDCNFFHQRKSDVGSTLVYNNTFINGNGGNYLTYDPNGPIFDTFINNIFRKGNNFCNGNPGCNAGQSSPYFVTNLASGTNPLFVGGFSSEDPRRYGLQSGSPARGGATTISGITTSNDMGAYDYGVTPWLPGCGF